MLLAAVFSCAAACAALGGAVECLAAVEAPAPGPLPGRARVPSSSAGVPLPPRRTTAGGAAAPGTGDGEGPLRILVATSSMPSHVFLAVKLARALADAGHTVELSAPAGKPVASAMRELASAPSESISVVAIGKASSTKPASERHVQNAATYATFWSSLFKPLKVAGQLATMNAELQEELYQPLLERLTDPATRPDVVVGTHSTLSAATDAAERAGVPALMLQGFPFDPAHGNGFRSGTWRVPRALSVLPHTGMYPAKPPPGVAGLMQLFWLRLDAALFEFWMRHQGAVEVTSKLRQERGLDPIVDSANSGSFQKVGMPSGNVPVIALGGEPFLAGEYPVPPQYTLVGALDDRRAAVGIRDDLGDDLADWLMSATKSSGSKVVLAAFGTGTELSAAEGAALSRGLAELAERHGVRTLLSLRASEQKFHFAALEAALGPPSYLSEADADGAVTAEFLGGAVRMQPRVPQRAVLLSGFADLFLSHCGFGSTSESFTAGVPLLAYPAGLDQWWNAQRSREAGVARFAPTGLKGLAEAVRAALDDDSLREGALRASESLARQRGPAKAVEAVENVARAYRAEA